MCPAVPLRLLRELGFVHKLGPGQAGEVLGGGHQAHGVTRDAKTEGRPYRAAYEWRRTKKGERRLCSFGNPRLYFRISLHSLCCFLSKTVLKATPHHLIDSLPRRTRKEPPPLLSTMVAGELLFSGMTDWKAVGRGKPAVGGVAGRSVSLIHGSIRRQ